MTTGSWNCACRIASFHDCSLETGALGWVPSSNRHILKSLGFTNAEVKAISNDMQLIARRCSYVIFLNRFNKDFQHFRISPRPASNDTCRKYFDGKLSRRYDKHTSKSQGSNLTSLKSLLSFPPRPPLLLHLSYRLSSKSNERQHSNDENLRASDENSSNMSLPWILMTPSMRNSLPWVLLTPLSGLLYPPCLRLNSVGTKN